MAKLSFYGGVDEIGGNKILLEDKGTRIFIDFGMQMGKLNQYFSQFVNPRKAVGMDDLLSFELLPRLNGMYRLDYSKHTGYDTSETSLDGVLLSHAHVDHCAYIKYLRPEIPIYCTEESKLIMQAFDDKGRGEQYVTYKEAFATYENKTGGLSRASRKDNRDERERNFSIIRGGKNFRIDSIEVEPVSIDHSLPGECGFIIYASDCTIGYTGDIRFHGRHPEDSQHFLDRCGNAGLDYVLCEGTRVGDYNKKTEMDVETNATDLIKGTKDLVVCSYPQRDLDRMLSFYNAARESGRKLVIDTNQAYLLKLFSESSACRGAFPNPDDKDVCIFLERKSWGMIGRKFEDERYEKILLEDYASWEKEFLGYGNAVNHADVKGAQKDYVFYCSDFKVQNLLDVKPAENSSYIRSLTEPFSPEMENDHDRVRRWLVHVGLLKPGEEWRTEHVSGHGDANQIEKVVDETSAAHLIPIHTEKAAEFSKMHDSVKLPVSYGSMDL